MQPFMHAHILACVGAVAQYPEGKEAGGLSGPPLMDLATDVLADMYRLTGKGALTMHHMFVLARALSVIPAGTRQRRSVCVYV
eukprot:1160558-Pelagomonas_calceolata.AAC.3